MWFVPDDLLEKLKCARCELHIRAAPVFSHCGGLLCGCCSNLLAHQAEASRQVGLEILLPHLILPCSYSRNGCKKRAAGYELEVHEEQCRYRFRNDTRLSTPSLQSTPSSPLFFPETRFFPIKNESRDLFVDLTCTAKGNRTTKKLTVLCYTMAIYNSDGNRKLCLVNGSRRRQHYPADSVVPIELSIEGAISLKSSPEGLYCDLKITPLQQDNEEVQGELCKSCGANFHGSRECCNWGHTLCHSCKETPCRKCTKQIEAQTKVACPNPPCTWRGAKLDLHAHEKDCNSALLNCAFPECLEKLAEYAMKTHLHQSHAESTHRGYTVDQQPSDEDKFWFMLAYNKLFLCKYLVYEEHVEFLVELYANCSSAYNYKYTVEVITPNNTTVIKHTKRCSIYNFSILDSGVTFTRKEIRKLQKDTCIFRVNIDFPL